MRSESYFINEKKSKTLISSNILECSGKDIFLIIFIYIYS